MNDSNGNWVWLFVWCAFRLSPFLSFPWWSINRHRLRPNGNETRLLSEKMIGVRRLQWVCFILRWVFKIWLLVVWSSFIPKCLFVCFSTVEIIVLTFLFVWITGLLLLRPIQMNWSSFGGIKVSLKWFDGVGLLNKHDHYRKIVFLPSKELGDDKSVMD